MTLGGTAGLTFTGGDGTDDMYMAFSGTLEDINAALDGMFFSAPSEPGTAPFYLTISDGDLDDYESLYIDLTS